MAAFSEELRSFLSLAGIYESAYNRPERGVRWSQPLLEELIVIDRELKDLLEMEWLPLHALTETTNLYFGDDLDARRWLTAVRIEVTLRIPLSQPPATESDRLAAAYPPRQRVRSGMGKDASTPARRLPSTMNRTPLNRSFITWCRKGMRTFRTGCLWGR